MYFNKCNYLPQNVLKCCWDIKSQNLLSVPESLAKLMTFDIFPVEPMFIQFLEAKKILLTWFSYTGFQEPINRKVGKK